MWLCWVVWTLSLFLHVFRHIQPEHWRSLWGRAVTKSPPSLQQHRSLAETPCAGKPTSPPVFTVLRAHCQLLLTASCTSSEQKAQRSFCSACVSSPRESRQANQVMLFVCTSSLHHPIPFLFLISRDNSTLVATPQHSFKRAIADECLKVCVWICSQSQKTHPVHNKQGKEKLEVVRMITECTTFSRMGFTTLQSSTQVCRHFPPLPL